MEIKKIPFNKEIFVDNLLVCKNGGENEKREAMLVVFRMLLPFIHNKIRRAVNNENNTSRVKKSSLFVTPEDLEIQAYLLLERCIVKLEVDKVDSFFYYFNKSWNRKIYNYLNDDLYQTNLDGVMFTLKGKEHIDDLNIDLSSVSLTEGEEQILESRIAGENLQDFFKQTGMNSLTYYSLLESLRKKLSYLKRDEDGNNEPSPEPNYCWSTGKREENNDHLYAR